MGKRDTLALCERDIKMLLYLKQHPRCEIHVIADFFKLSYARANELINKFFTAGYVEKHRKEKMMLGGEKLEISISKKGISFLKDMHEEFKIVFNDDNNKEN